MQKTTTAEVVDDKYVIKIFIWGFSEKKKMSCLWKSSCFQLQLFFFPSLIFDLNLLSLFFFSIFC